LAAGEALGTKAIGVVFLPPLIALVIAGVWFQAGPARVKVVRTLVVLLVPMITGGIWFCRNAALTGNPLYPLEVRWMGRTLLPGWYGPEAMRTSQFYVPFAAWRALGDILLGILDPRLTPFWLVAIAGAWAVSSRTTQASRRGIVTFSLMAVLNVVLYWV